METRIERKIIEETIARGNRSVSGERFTFGDIRSNMESLGLTLQDSDIIECGYDEGYEGSDSGMDPSLFFRVIRKRTESDDEYNARMEEIERDEKRRKRLRHESYLKLKEEFGGNE
jgi:hypothetical protein